MWQQVCLSPYRDGRCLTFSIDQPLHTVLTDERPQPPTWGTTGAGGGWGASVDNAGRGWGVSAENVGETWGMGGGNLSQQQGSDDSSLGQSEILQPPPSHTPGVLATIPEQTPPLTPYNQNRRPLSDIGENNDEYSDWDNQPDSRTTHWGENPQSHTLTATMAPSAMGSPPSQPTVSLAEAAAAAQKDLQKQGKTTTASEAARRLEESRRHSVDPQHLAAQQEASRAAHAVQHAANKKPVSSASAAAAALEGSHLRHRNIKQTDTVHSQPAPGKTSWIHPKPFMEGGRDPAHIPPDPSWIHTGGNTWSRKHLASKSVSAVNWAQPIETPWSQPHSYPPPPQGQLHRPSHKKHHSHAVYPTQHNHRPSASQHHQSWLSWGKERWIESPETESGSEDDGVNIVDSWGTYNSQHVDQGKGRDKRGRRRKDDESENRGGKGGWPQQGKAAWGEQRNEGVEHKDNDWRGGDQWGGNFGGGQDHKASVWGQEKAVWGEQRHEGGEHRDNERQGGDQWGGAFGRAQDHKASVWGQNKDPIGTEWSHDNSGPGRGHERNGSAWVEDEGKGWNNSNWNQDYNWGKDKGTGGNESGWGEQQAGDTRATGGWSQTGINDWGKKIPSTAEVVGGTRAAMSPQQISQIYNSFLNVNQTSELKGQGQQHSKTMASSKKNDQGIWEAESGWGSEADEEGGTPRRVRFSPKASELWGGSPRSVPSKTMAASQQQGVTTTLINDTSNARFVESRGAGLAFVSNALFGNTRLSKERIYWLFPQDKDHRISALLAWVQKMSFNLGTYGVSFVFYMNAPHTQSLIATLCS